MNSHKPISIWKFTHHRDFHAVQIIFHQSTLRPGGEEWERNNFSLRGIISSTSLAFGPVFIFLNIKLILNYSVIFLVPGGWKEGTWEHGVSSSKRKIVSSTEGDNQKTERWAEMWQHKASLNCWYWTQGHPTVDPPSCVVSLSTLWLGVGREASERRWTGGLHYRESPCIEADSWHPYLKGWVHWKLPKSGAWNCLDSFKKSCLSSCKCKLRIEDIPRSNFLLHFQVYVPACAKMAWGPARRCQIVLNCIFHFGMLMFSSLTQILMVWRNRRQNNKWM